MQSFLLCPLLASNVGSETSQFYPLFFSYFLAFLRGAFHWFHHFLLKLLPFFPLFFYPLAYLVLFTFFEDCLALCLIEEKLVLDEERVFDDFFRLGLTFVFFSFFVEFGCFEILRRRVWGILFEEIERWRWRGVILLWYLG